MNHSTASVIVHFLVKDRSSLRNVLAELSARSEGELLLRKGRVTAEGARMEVEIRAGREKLEDAFRSLDRPEVTIHSYSAFGRDQVSPGDAHSGTIGGPTLPPVSASRFRVPVAAH